jgi:hypothetical protein
MDVGSRCKLTVVACVLMFGLCVEAQTNSRAPKTSVVHKTAEVAGHVIWDKPCEGLCAAGRFPRYYEFVATDTVFKSVSDVLQELGFALNPKGLKPKDPEFNAESKRKEVHSFWTDLIPLDDATLKKFGTTRAALRLSDDVKVFYAIQIAFTCSAQNPLYEAALEDPKRTRERIANSHGTTASSETETQIDFAFSLILRKRGQKSTYVDDSSEYDNRPVLDWLYERITERIHQLKPDMQMDAETGDLLG